MYNRYIPQPDGSFQRKRMEEPQRHPPQTQPEHPPEPSCPPAEDPKCPAAPPQPHRESSSTGSFLQQLLPRDFDTGDLIVIVLLLLIAGDCEQERSNALLTLALYFIM